MRNSGGKKIRGAAAKNHKEKSEREERERLRLEAKRKREGRAERRRVDGKISADTYPRITLKSSRIRARGGSTTCTAIRN